MYRFCMKLLILVLMITGLQLALGRWQLPVEILQLDRGLVEEPDILFLGDSSNFKGCNRDEDKRPISEMLQGLLPDERVLTIDHAAYHMDVYLAYCRYVAKRNNKISKVLIPINLRSFSVSWDQRPGWQFEKEQLLLDHGGIRHLFWPFFKPLSIFKAVKLNPISPEAYDEMPVFCVDEPMGKVKEFTSPDYDNVTDRETVKQLVFQYMYRLTPDHAKLEAMLKIPEVLKPHGVEAVFYITPIDVEIGEKYLSGRFKERVRENTKIVKDLLQSKNVPLIDLSESVPTDLFAWRDEKYPNEHLDQRGRLFVAEKLFERIKQCKGEGEGLFVLQD